MATVNSHNFGMPRLPLSTKTGAATNFHELGIRKAKMACSVTAKDVNVATY